MQSSNPIRPKGESQCSVVVADNALYDLIVQFGDELKSGQQMCVLPSKDMKKAALMDCFQRMI